MKPTKRVLLIRIFWTAIFWTTFFHVTDRLLPMEYDTPLFMACIAGFALTTKEWWKKTGVIELLKNL